jgi:hypothetical protein
MTTPKVNVPAVKPGDDAAMYIFSLTDPNAVGTYMDFYVAAMATPPDDPDTVELIRIRNAVAHACEY